MCWLFISRSPTTVGKRPALTTWDKLTNVGGRPTQTTRQAHHCGEKDLLRLPETSSPLWAEDLLIPRDKLTTVGWWPAQTPRKKPTTVVEDLLRLPEWSLPLPITKRRRPAQTTWDKLTSMVKELLRLLETSSPLWAEENLQCMYIF